MTSAQGCGVRAMRGPARKGFASDGATVTARFLGGAGRRSLRLAQSRAFGRERSGLVGFATRGGASRRSLRLHLVPAELVPEGGCDLHRVAVLLPRGEAGEQRMGQHRRGDVVRDRLLDRPAAFTGVRDVPLDVREVAAFDLEGTFGELEQPRAHDAALIPYL